MRSTVAWLVCFTMATGPTQAAWASEDRPAVTAPVNIDDDDPTAGPATDAGVSAAKQASPVGDSAGGKAPADETVFTPPPSETDVSVVHPLSTAPMLPDPSPDDPGNSQRWLGIGLIGAGALGIGLGTVFGLDAKSKLDDSNAGHCGSTDRCDAQGLVLRQDATTAATLSTVSFAAGGIALAGGVVLYWTAQKPSKSISVAITPVPLGWAGAGATVTGRF